MNLFIDTNVFLSFFHLSNDDLEEIHKLSALLDQDEVILWVTEQVEQEFLRNRENKISDALKKLKEHKIKGPFPQFCKDYEEYSTLKGLQKEYERAHSQLMRSVMKDAVNHTFNADKKIEELFSKSQKITTNDELLRSAQKRVLIGNPPGKNGSYGDAINWEALLENIPKGEALHIIADDKDYYSTLDENRPKTFILKEWYETKSPEIYFYRRLSAFFKEHYPEIRIASDFEKEAEINALSTSGNFSRTHTVINKLSKLEDFSANQVNLLIEIAKENNQVRWIFSDADIYEFYLTLLEQYKKDISETNLEILEELLKKNEDDYNLYK